jgi:hypothetical protein
MSGIANITPNEFRGRVNRFAQKYVNDWNCWLNTDHNDRAQQLGIILRKWQACRPNRMRRTMIENIHGAPYIEDLIHNAADMIRTLQSFEIQNSSSFSANNCLALEMTWNIFEHLSYHGNSRNGLTGIVGISKCVLLLTDGRVGPAFDSKVKSHLGIKNISNAIEWIDALKIASQDIQDFESNNQLTIQQASPKKYSGLQIGRIYDMALGPG